MCDDESIVLGRADDIEYSLYREADWEGVKGVLYNAFFANEMVSRGCELNLDLPAAEHGRRELTALSADTLRDGVSVVARDLRTGRIVAAAINKMQYLSADPAALGYFESFKRQHCTSPNAHGLIDFMSGVDALVDLFAHLRTDCLFEIMFLATLPSHEGRRIGQTLCAHSIGLARQLSEGRFWAGVSPEVQADRRRPRAVSAIFTSAFSQRIGERLGFEKLAAKGYDELEFEGRTFASRIADEQHKDAALVAFRL